MQTNDADDYAGLPARAQIAEVIATQLLHETGPAAEIDPLATAIALRVARDIVASGVSFLVVDDGNAILCLRCGRISHNPNDVAKLYCGACHRFHEES